MQTLWHGMWTCPPSAAYIDASLSTKYLLPGTKISGRPALSTYIGADSLWHGLWTCPPSASAGNVSFEWYMHTCTHTHTLTHTLSLTHTYTLTLSHTHT